MENLDGLVTEVGKLRKDLEDLRHQVVQSGIVPPFTRNMMWAFLAISIFSLVASLGLLYGGYLLLLKVQETLVEIHKIYSLLE